MDSWSCSTSVSGGGNSPVNNGKSFGDRLAYHLGLSKIWLGCDLRSWSRLLLSSGCSISMSRLPAAVGVTAGCALNTLGGCLQSARYHKALNSETIHVTPVFVVGHWRSGTTLLHELLGRDPKGSMPTCLECFLPHVCLLLSEDWASRLPAYLPAVRPMDAVQLGWDRGQEDEFFFCNRGLRTPYYRFAFPQRWTCADDFWGLFSMTEHEEQQFVANLFLLLKIIQLRRRRAKRSIERVVLKSPTHTARIAFLNHSLSTHLKERPRFLHIVRNPFEIYLSTERLWQRMCDDQGLHAPKFDAGELSHFIVTIFRKMHEASIRDIAGLPKDQYQVVRYEDIDPNRNAKDRVIHNLRRVYGEFGLELEDTSSMRTFLDEPFRQNSHRTLGANELKLLQREWKDYFDRFGYSSTPRCG
ncbi:MAG: sulfotransferase [Pyrinomonadaceae bacterium]